MGKIRPGPPLTFTEEKRTLFIHALIETGSLTEAIRHTHSVSRSHLHRILKQDSEFAEQVNLAKLAHKVKHPERNADRLILIDETIERELQEGEKEVIERVDPETDQVLARTVKHRFRFSPKLYEIYHPQPNWSETSILFVTSNLLNDLTIDPELTEKEREKFIKWLSRWIKKAVGELAQHGLPAQLLDVHEQG
jgi:hypothetical protein